jgi:hypothetical protein
MYKYQNVSKVQQTITANGNITPRVVEAGETLLSSVAIENPNFKYLGEDQSDSAGVTGTVVTQENQVNEAVRLDNENKEENK